MRAKRPHRSNPPPAEKLWRRTNKKATNVGHASQHCLVERLRRWLDGRREARSPKDCSATEPGMSATFSKGQWQEKLPTLSTNSLHTPVPTQRGSATAQVRRTDGQTSLPTRARGHKSTLPGRKASAPAWRQQSSKISKKRLLCNQLWSLCLLQSPIQTPARARPPHCQGSQKPYIRAVTNQATPPAAGSVATQVIAILPNMPHDTLFEPYAVAATKTMAPT